MLWLLFDQLELDLDLEVLSISAYIFLSYPLLFYLNNYYSSYRFSAGS